MAAKPKSTSSANAFKPRRRRKNPGVHAKTKTSRAKGSPNYKKPYNKQGR
jgi:hypothetical protein